MKDTIKNSIIGAFAIFGLVALISSSNTAPTVIHEGTPESHVWGMHSAVGGTFAINKVTGEVRKYRTGINMTPKDSQNSQWYISIKEKQ